MIQSIAATQLKNWDSKETPPIEGLDCSLVVEKAFFDIINNY